jgi:hypothetical protein
MDRLSLAKARGRDDYIWFKSLRACYRHVREWAGNFSVWVFLAAQNWRRREYREHGGKGRESRKEAHSDILGEMK